MAYKIVDADQLDADLTTVADAIREKTGETEKLSFPEGMAEGVDAAFEAGKKAEYDAFWDFYQESGKRTNYSGAFSGVGWNDMTFSPKYNLTNISSSIRMFSFSSITDLVKLLRDKAIEFDTSQASDMSNMFSDNVYIKTVPIIDARLSRSLQYFFYGCNSLVRCERIILSQEKNQSMQQSFYNCTALQEIEFDGPIKGELDCKWSTLLSKASIISILNALSDDTDGLTVTLSPTAVNNAFETSEGAGDGSTSEEWLALVDTKSNWTISLMDA